MYEEVALLRTKKITVLVLVALLAVGLSACGMDNDRNLTRGYDNNPNLTRSYDNPNMLNGQNGVPNDNNMYNRNNRYNTYNTPNPNGLNNNYNNNYYGPNRYRTNSFRTNANGDAERMANIAGKVKGVDDATVVIAGGTAYVGLNLEDRVNSQNAQNVETKVYNAIKKAAASRYNISITSDADMFGRLRDVGDGIRGGSPLNQFDNDLRDFDNRFRTFTR